MEILYVTLSCAALTWFRWNQHIQGRSYPFVGISCLYGVWMLANGITIPLDSVTVATLALALWMMGSLLYSQKPFCVYEFFNWISYFVLFTAARMIPLEIVMWILIPNATIFAALQLYNSTKYELTDEARRYPVFGNSNHNAAFLIVGFYAALWLATSTPAMYAVAALIGVAIIASKRRGPMLAMIVSLCAAIVMTRMESLAYIALIIVALCIPNRHRVIRTFNGMLLSDRMDIYRDAWKKIHPRYLLGRGLNYYRDTRYGRVHNDFLELTGEIGIIGLLLFLNIFYQMSLEPIMLCAVIAYFIDAMFFYPLREQHTACPFWAMVGAAAGFGVPASMTILQVVGVLVVLSTMTFVFMIYSNLVEWTLGEARKREDKRVDRQESKEFARLRREQAERNRVVDQGAT